MQDAHDLEVILDCRTPLIVLETHDELRAIDLLLRVARKRQQPLSRWTLTDGLRRMDFGLQLEATPEHTEPESVLNYLKTRAESGLYVLCDFHHWLDDHPKNIRLLKDIALRNSMSASTVILLSHELQLPQELSRLSAQFNMSLPSDDQILELIKDEAKRWGTGNGNRKVKTDNDTLQLLIRNLQGLAHDEVRRLVRGAIIDDGAITETDFPDVNKAKFKLMNLDGVLSYEYNTERFDNVGGMIHLKEWLAKRQSIFNGEASIEGIDTPKGILLLGVQGGGKSLAAKAVAGMWKVPILRLDIGALFNKYHGETERNLRESLELAEKMQPCVLWVDEIEKSVSSEANDSGTSQRVLGSLLTWMAEKTAAVFIVATANDVSKLPPELIRKGRIDELFFVDLPTSNIREDIFEIHLLKRNLELSEYQLEELSAATEGFTGAEIEQVIVAGLYSALAQKTPVTQSMLLEEIRKTSPLSIVMGERLAQLRAWADDRGVVKA